MPIVKKKIKSKRKNLKETEVKNLDDKKTNQPKDNLTEKIKDAAEGLIYISESDAEIMLFDGGQAKAVTKEEILSRTKKPADSAVEQRKFTEFFARLTEIQDWFGDEEKETAQKYARLKELLERNLRDLKVFKIGKIELDVYIVGLDAENKLLGIKTKAVET